MLGACVKRDDVRLEGTVNLKALDGERVSNVSTVGSGLLGMYNTCSAT
jgi:hypothetical protein